MKWISLLAICLSALGGIAAAQEDVSSATLAQFAVGMMGDTNQNAEVAGFAHADSYQFGYSGDGKVTQTIFYDDIGSGTIYQWGESGTMTRDKRDYYFDSVGDTVNITNWVNGEVNQTAFIRNSENIRLTQMVGDLYKTVKCPDGWTCIGGNGGNGGNGRYGQGLPIEPDFNSDWWFCGKPINGTGGLPLCALKIGKKIQDGTATSRDLYILSILEEYYDVFPPENFTPHVTLTDLNMSEVDGNLVIKFKAHNFGRKTYNATPMLELTPRITIPDSWTSKKNPESRKVNQFKAADENLEEIKVPGKQVIELGNYIVPRMKSIEKEVVIPLKDMKINSLQMKMVSE